MTFFTLLISITIFYCLTVKSKYIGEKFGHFFYVTLFWYSFPLLMFLNDIGKRCVDCSAQSEANLYEVGAGDVVGVVRRIQDIWSVKINSLFYVFYVKHRAIQWCLILTIGLAFTIKWSLALRIAFLYIFSFTTNKTKVHKQHLTLGITQTNSIRWATALTSYQFASAQSFSLRTKKLKHVYSEKLATLRPNATLDAPI